MLVPVELALKAGKLPYQNRTRLSETVASLERLPVACFDVADHLMKLASVGSLVVRERIG